MRGSPALAALMAASAMCLAAGASAQDACDLLQSRSSTVLLTGEGVFNYISEPVFGCAGGVVIRADSAELDDASGFTRFIGNFEYRDSTAFMTADRADHFASAGRLIGVGNVHIVDEATGAVFEGDSTVLVGSSSRRTDGQLTIVGRDGRRAHAVILVSPRAAAPDSAGTAPDSAATVVDVVADSSAAESDSTAADPEGTAAPADSALVPEAQAVPADSGAAAGPVDAAEDSAPVARESPDVPVDSAAVRDTTPVPYDIDAEHIYLSGTSYMLATGAAELYNDEFRALADSIEYRQEVGRLFLRGTAPRVYGYGAEYVLSGDAVDMDVNGNQVAARGAAALAGSEIDLTAPEIRVLTQDGVLDRIVAMNERPPEPGIPGPVGEAGPSGLAGTGIGGGEPTPDVTATAAGAAGATTGEASDIAPAEAADVAPVEPGDSTTALPPARPRAVAEAFELEGDSIDVQAPNEVLERVVAVGSARGEALGRDSLNTENTPEIARSDWVSGDTIIAIFRPVAAETPPEADAEPVAGEAGGGGYQLDRLVARGEAASLYRMSPSDGGDGEEEAEGQESAPQEAADPARPNPADEMPGESAPEEPTLQAAAEEAAGEEGSAEPAQQTETEGASDTPAVPEETPEEEAAPKPAPEPEQRLALHYVRGDLITIFMQDGEVTSVTVEGNARGIQLEPVPPPRPDTTAAPPSTRR